MKHSGDILYGQINHPNWTEEKFEVRIIMETYAGFWMTMFKDKRKKKRIAHLTPTNKDLDSMIFNS